MIQLTIGIPAYNAEQYLRKCLDSMVGLDDRLEIIVVNDGSTDTTAMLAQEYVDRYPQQVVLLNKENGGHGSAINATVDLAKGRYIKIIDADDWIVSENLSVLLDALERTSADAVVTNYHTVDMVSGKQTPFAIGTYDQPVEISFGEMMRNHSDIFMCCVFHGLAYRTEFFRSTGIRMTEKVFYEDQEYATLPFAFVERVLICPYFFYEYMTGNANQSMATQNQIKRIGQLETVIRSVVSYFEQKTLSQERREYFLRKIDVVVGSYFSVALLKDPDKKRGKEAAQQLYDWLNTVCPDLMPRISKKYRAMCIFHRFRCSEKIFVFLRTSRLYKLIYRIWTK